MSRAFFNFLAPPFRLPLFFLLFLPASLLRAGNAPAEACTYYASPDGNGDGSSPSSPFRIAGFWKVARPGMSLCLLDGVYKGSDSVIAPPAKLSGSRGLPITVKALNDGKVLITGESVRRPVFLNSNDWIVVEGINACCSNRTVVEITYSSNDTIRRVAAWDALDGNEKIFGIHNATHNLLEDVAGWGTARKIFEFSYGGDFTTVRRAWGRWERSTVKGPKMVYSLAYNNSYTLIENSLGTWSGEGMPATYVLRDFYGRTYTGAGGGPQRNHDVFEAYGVFSMDGVLPGAKADARLLGSLAYVNAADTFKPKRLVFVTKMDGVEIANTVAHYPPNAFPDKITFGLYPLVNGDPTADVAAKITGFGGAGPEIKRGWAVENQLHGSAPASTYRAGETLFNTNRGANLCHRYKDGVLTDEALWPWPMNQRLIDGLVQSGREPVDVTATVERMFGPIPSPCRIPDREVASPRQSQK